MQNEGDATISGYRFKNISGLANVTEDAKMSGLDRLSVLAWNSQETEG